MHLKERVRLSHSTKADIITKELTNRNQQEKCCAFLNLTQRAHKFGTRNNWFPFDRKEHIFRNNSSRIMH